MKNDHQIKAVPIQKTILAVNNFIVNTTIFLNNFSNDCEGKFIKISSRITDLETLLMIFEAKLNSINIDIDEKNTSNNSADPGPIVGTGGTNAMSSSGYSNDDRDGSVLVGGKDGANIPSNSTGDMGYTGDPYGQRSSPTPGGLSSSSNNKSPLSPPPPPPVPPPPPPPVPALPSPSLSSPITHPGSPHGAHHDSSIKGEGEGERSTVGEGGGEGGGGGGGGRVKAKDHPDYIGYFKMMKVTTYYTILSFPFLSLCPVVCRVSCVVCYVV